MWDNLILNVVDNLAILRRYLDWHTRGMLLCLSKEIARRAGDLACYAPSELQVEMANNIVAMFLNKENPSEYQLSLDQSSLADQGTTDTGLGITCYHGATWTVGIVALHKLVKLRVDVQFVANAAVLPRLKAEETRLDRYFLTQLGGSMPLPVVACDEIEFKSLLFAPYLMHRKSNTRVHLNCRPQREPFDPELPDHILDVDYYNVRGVFQGQPGHVPVKYAGPWRALHELYNDIARYHFELNQNVLVLTRMHDSVPADWVCPPNLLFVNEANRFVGSTRESWFSVMQITRPACVILSADKLALNFFGTASTSLMRMCLAAGRVQMRVVIIGPESLQDCSLVEWATLTAPAPLSLHVVDDFIRHGTGSNARGLARAMAEQLRVTGRFSFKRNLTPSGVRRLVPEYLGTRLPEGYISYKDYNINLQAHPTEYLRGSFRGALNLYRKPDGEWTLYVSAWDDCGSELKAPSEWSFTETKPPTALIDQFEVLFFALTGNDWSLFPHEYTPIDGLFQVVSAGNQQVPLDELRSPVWHSEENRAARGLPSLRDPGWSSSAAARRDASPKRCVK